MNINQQNIAAFISELFKERRGEIAPPELLQKWQSLSDYEINQQLDGLFQSWGMSSVEKNIAIERFLKRQQTSFQPQSKPTTQNPTSYNYPTTSNNKKSYSWIGYLLLVVILISGLFIGYKYLQFSSMDKIYAITDNIAVRDKDGKSVARMDLYDRDGDGTNSYSKMRAVDDKVYYRSYDGTDKEFPTRKVLSDTTDFIDYLTKLDDVALYVNTNFVVNDKKEFNFYQSAFKEIQNTASDNAELKALYRKVIVGSMATSNDMEGKYLVNYTKGLSKTDIKNTSAFVIQQLKIEQHYVIIAAMNDGLFYRFEGDIKTNEFSPPLVINTITNDEQTPLKGAYRFVNNNGKTNLYDVINKKATDYELIQDVMGKNVAFQYTAPKQNPLETIIDTIFGE